MPPLSPQAIALGASSLITTLLLVRVARDPEKRLLTPLLSTSHDPYALVVLLVSILIWQATQTLEFLIPRWALGFHHLGFVGVAVIPPAALRLAQTFAGVRHPSVGVLAVIPAITILMNAYEPWTPIFWSGRVVTAFPFLLESTRGPWFWVHTASSYACLTATFAILGVYAVRHPLRRREAVIMGSAIALPVAANLVELAAIGFQDVALTPLALGGTGVILTWTMLRDSNRDLLQPLRRAIVDAMHDPVFVVANATTLAYANRAGRELLGISQLRDESLQAVPDLARFVETNASEGDIQFEVDAQPRHFHAVRSTLDDRDRIEFLVLRDVTRDRTSRAQIQQLAFFDPLTGLPNRRLFKRRFESALSTANRERGLLAVLMIDVDRFKQVNDTLGHAAGDDLLRHVGETLLDALRPCDEVAFEGQGSVSRVGGDEFIVLLTGLPESRIAVDVAHRLCDELDTPIAIDGQELLPRISVGVAIHPQHGSGETQLLRAADEAMYRAKEQPGNAVHVAKDPSSGLPTAPPSSIGLEASLRHGFERDEFELFYQPIEDFESGRMVGAEALIRWRHPSGRLVGPAEFIGIAEDCGLVVPIGRWALEQATEQVQKWNAVHPGFCVKVNVSPVQLRDETFVESLQRRLASIETPSILDLELTERVLIHDLEGCEETLQAISKLGVRLTLDDFGTGYSSLAYLHRLPFDAVKIDRSFVSGLPDCDRSARICRAIIDMAHGLGLTVIGEGVETEVQRESLRGMGCDALQGFLIARPMEAAQLDALLASDPQQIWAPERDA